MKLLLTLSLLILLTVLAAAQDPTATPAPVWDSPNVEQLVPEVLSTREHDSAAFTQGLLLHAGKFYESTGLYGQSSLREIDFETNEILRGVRLPNTIFAEGLALVDDRLIQLTWQNQGAIVWDIETFQPVGVFEYEGEGWGLCYDGQSLWMSDGSSTLFERDPETFEVLREVEVTLDGVPVTQLNELECVADSVYANVWYTDYILRIDKAEGAVTGVIDAASLLTDEERAALPRDGAVLNGIAYDAENKVFWVTGKLWPTLFEVRFVALEDSASE